MGNRCLFDVNYIQSVICTIKDFTSGNMYKVLPRVRGSGGRCKTKKVVDLYSGSLACKVQLNELPSFRQYVAVQRKTAQNVVSSYSFLGLVTTIDLSNDPVQSPIYTM